MYLPMYLLFLGSRRTVANPHAKVLVSCDQSVEVRSQTTQYNSSRMPWLVWHDTCQSCVLHCSILRRGLSRNDERSGQIKSHQAKGTKDTILTGQAEKELLKFNCIMSESDLTAPGVTALNSWNFQGVHLAPNEPIFKRQNTLEWGPSLGCVYFVCNAEGIEGAMGGGDGPVSSPPERITLRADLLQTSTGMFLWTFLNIGRAIAEAEKRVSDSILLHVVSNFGCTPMQPKQNIFS